MLKSDRSWQSIFRTVEEKDQFAREWDRIRASIKFQNVSRETLATLTLRIIDILDTTKCCVEDSECLYPTTNECNSCRLKNIRREINEVLNNEKEN